MTSSTDQSVVDEDDFSSFTSKAEVRAYIERTRNWGRWGDDDQRGTVNLITPELRVAAAGLVRDGVTVSLSRPLATTPGVENPWPVQHFMETLPRGDGAGAAHDYLVMGCHGAINTHIDALTHVWDDDGMLYNGVEASSAIGYHGSTWGALEHWRDGIVTRGVLLDVAASRSKGYVTNDEPVTAEVLERVAKASGVELQPGDAVAIHSGRERYNEENPTWGSEAARPGVDVSCIKFLRQHDCSVLLWDMGDRKPVGLGLPWGVHLAIPAYGLVLVDQVKLDDLAATCERLSRNEFLLSVSPLYLNGGTGSPVNPTAVF
jgi:kynurenine formamidase